MIPQDLPLSSELQEIFDRSYEEELAFFFKTTYEDLIDGIITLDEAIARIERIRR